MPFTSAVPSVGCRYVVRIFIVVDLPAPLGPSKPTTSPCFTSNETLSNAFTGP